MLSATVLRASHHSTIRNGRQLRHDEALVEAAMKGVEADPLTGSQSLRLFRSEAADADRVVGLAWIEDVAELVE